MDQDKNSALGHAANGWTDTAIRFALVALIVYWSFLRLRPFIAILIWAAILSVAMYPIFLWLKHVLGGRTTLASFLLTALALVVLLGPVSTLGAALVNNLSGIATGISEGTITVPPPPPYVAEWPFIGSKLSAFWQAASVGLAQTLALCDPTDAYSRSGGCTAGNGAGLPRRTKASAGGRSSPGGIRKRACPTRAP